MKEINTNEEMLECIRNDRPDQVINKVISFKLNEYGFYDVDVDMESMFFETKILHVHTTLPYPYSSYEELAKKVKTDWTQTTKLPLMGLYGTFGENK